MSSVQRILSDVLRYVVPDRLKPHLAGVYNNIRSARADHRFTPAKRDFEEPSDEPRHVVLVVVDALRDDVITPETTPFLTERRLCSAVTASPWTYPSVISILTGQYPNEHGKMRQTDEADPSRKSSLSLPPKLETNAPTISRMLAGAGIETYGGFGFMMPFIALRGHFDTHQLYRHGDAESVLTDHRSWLESCTAERTFSYIHLADLHSPLDPPEKYLRRFDVNESVGDLANWEHTDETRVEGEIEEYVVNKKRMYEAAATYVDDCLSDYCDDLPQSEDVNIVITGDHGEAFWEFAAFDSERFYDNRPAYSVAHGGTPYESITRVPLISESLTVANQTGVSLIDLAPTLLTCFGIDPPEIMTGRPLQFESPDDRILLTEASRYGYEKKTVYGGKWKLLRSKSDGEEVAFRLQEEEKVATPPEEVRDQLSSAFPAWPSSDPDEEDNQRVSGTVESRLKNLGYK